jgi:transglutaminase-like putative cysteine protease
MSPFRITVIAAWLVLIAALAGREMLVREVDRHELQVVREARQERFYGVWFQKRRIGYVAETMKPQDGEILLTQEAHILLNVLETEQPVDMKVTATLTPQLVLRDFDFSFSSPLYSMQANGYVRGETVHFTLDTGHASITDSVRLAGPPLLAVNDRSYLLRQLDSPGDRIKVPSFDPLSLSGRESVITYHGREKILVNRRVKELHHYSEIFSGIRVNFWLDEQGRIVKEESPAGFQFIAEPEFRARDVTGAGGELLASVAVPPAGELPVKDATRATFRLSLPPDAKLDLQGGRQELAGNLLTVTLEEMPPSAPPDAGACGSPEFLRAGRFVQSGHQDIREAARRIAGDTDDPAVQVRRLAGWMYRNLEKKPVLGLPDALTTLHTGQGDCNEHASLFAAMARSLGIPTVIATGVTLQRGAFYYHAWNEVCLGGSWYSLDTTTNQLPADVFHIRFGRGDLDQHLQVGALLGNLAITIISQQTGEK